MKCRYSEHDLALYVEHDVSQPVLSAIEAHLLQCETCSGLAADLRESQVMFKSLRHEMPSGAALSEVRLRVLGTVGGLASTTPWGRKVERWLWIVFRRGYAVGGAGLAILACAGLWHMLPPQHFSLPDPLPPAAAVPLAAAPAGTPDPVPVRSARGESARRPRADAAVHHSPRPAAADPDPLPAPAEQPKQLVVKLLTDDPGVVIYWLVDQIGG